jgi:exopolyphosphatase/guanosine-5'-triphosphate,3'-diphosphate pyrophosphatase
MARAAIDIGSNSILLTVMERGRVLHDQAVVVGLGRGLGDRGRFQDERMAHARQVLADYVRRAEALGVAPFEIQAVATSGARRASNAEDFFGRIRSELGLRVRTVTGEEEARLSYLGALHDLELPGEPVLVVDLGGGSTELILGDHRGMRYKTSVELGAVRLTETHGLDRDGSGLDSCMQEIHDKLSAVILPDAPGAVVNVAGTATTLAAMELGLEVYDGSQVHGCELSLDRLRDWGRRLAASSAQERRDLAHLAPDRADYLLAGSCVLAAVLERSSQSSTLVSDGGLRFGLLR